jgi:hypothetical protein
MDEQCSWFKKQKQVRMDPFVKEYYDKKQKEAGWNRTDKYPICSYT